LKRIIFSLLEVQEGLLRAVDKCEEYGKMSKDELAKLEEAVKKPQIGDMIDRATVCAVSHPALAIM
jgi:hypothetical protein